MSTAPERQGASFSMRAERLATCNGIARLCEIRGRRYRHWRYVGLLPLAILAVALCAAGIANLIE